MNSQVGEVETSTQSDHGPELYPFVSFSRFVYWDRRVRSKLQFDSSSNSLLLVVFVESTQIIGRRVWQSWHRYCPSEVPESEVAVGWCGLSCRQSWFAWFAVAVLGASWIDRRPMGSPGIATVQAKSPESEVAAGWCGFPLASPGSPGLLLLFGGPLGLIVVQ